MIIYLKQKTINLILPLIKIQLFLFNFCLTINTKILLNIFKILKYHFKYQFKLLIYITALDFLNNNNRFTIIYEILSIKFNNRLRIKILINEIITVFSIKNVYLASIWWENEIWDMFGVIFLKRNNLIRLLTDYGFQGFPLRKDFPLAGFIDLKYNLIKNKISYNNLELTQNYRNFVFNSPWN